jgi:hypothetical protein
MDFGFKTISPEDWAELLSGFADATIYQTAAYADVRWGAARVRRVALTQGVDVLALAQIVHIPLPGLTRGGIAYCPQGPLTRRSGISFDPGVFSAMTSFLRQEFSVNRGALLRVAPPLFPEADADSVRAALNSGGFYPSRFAKNSRTIIADLSPPLDDLRAGLQKTWRSSLSKAERSDLSIESGTGPEVMEIFAQLYGQMLARKQFSPGADYREFLRMQPLLPNSQKMRVWVCRYKGRPINAAIVSAIGAMPIYLFGASGDQPAGLNGSYLLQWRIIEWLKEKGFPSYDLGGIDPEANPNVYHFKAGLAGKTGKEKVFLPAYEICDSVWNAALVQGVETLRRWKRVG